MVGLAHQQLQAGAALSGQRVTIRLDGKLAHVILDDGTLWRTKPFAISAAKRARLQGARPADQSPRPAPEPVRVQRTVSGQGSIHVIGQRIQVGYGHARTTVTVEVGETTLTVHDEHGMILRQVPRTSSKEVTRHKAYGHQTFKQA